VVHVAGKLVTLVGVDGLVIVDTGDALLVCRGDQDQRVKEIIDRLEGDGRSDLL
jgi:mannose-1-phosphate guanylyltransferase